MKITSTLLLLFCAHLASAQPRLLPASANPSNETALGKAFNSDTIRLLSATIASTPGGILVALQKSDTLTFKHPFYKKGEGENYTLQGVAYYQKQTNGSYRLRFANDYALFCASCNNMHGYTLSVHKDTVHVSVVWGPQAFSADDSYTFAYRRETQRWQLVRTFTNGSDDAGEYRRIYREFTPSVNLYLDNYVAESTSFPESSDVASEVKLYYTPGKYKELLDTLYRFPQRDFPLLPLLLSADDADAFTIDPITNKQVQNANDIGYFLEQANNLPAAEIFLKKVIEAFPKREVAYYNLGDVYRKQGNKRMAAIEYNTYVNLMNERKLQSKIPQKVLDYVNANKGLLVD